MKYNINFNQKAVIDNKWDCLTANHMVLLDCLVGSFNTRKLKTLNEHGDIWYWLSVSEILKQAPILRIKERQCRNIIKDLSDCGLVELHPENKKLGKHYIRSGINYQKLLYSEPMQNFANLPNEPMHNNANTYAKNCNSPMQNIADYNSINNNRNNIIKKEKTDIYFESIFEMYKKNTPVGSHKSKAKEQFQKLTDIQQQKLHEYLKEFVRRRQKILAAKGWVKNLPAMERFIRNREFENVDLPEVTKEIKQQAEVKFL